MTINKYKNEPIATVITNQKLISGIGNYLRAESLWMAKINPHRKVSSLSTHETHELFKSLKAWTWGMYNYNKAVKLGYLDNIKIPSDYNRDYFVYDQQQDIYGNKVQKQNLNDRTIHWVPEVQK